MAVTVPEYPERTVQPDVSPVPLVPGTVPVVPAGHVTATEGGRERREEAKCVRICTWSWSWYTYPGHLNLSNILSK